MKLAQCALAAAALFVATGASAQSINLTGAYRCVEGCKGAPIGAPAFVTQNGSTLNLVSENGSPSRAWPDMFAPASRIWADRWDTGAVYSPDGMLIQFDSGTIWQREMGPVPLQVPPRVRARRAELVR